MNPVVHFEIPAKETERAKKFYADVFGWNIQEWPMSNGGTYIGASSTEIDEETSLPKKPGAINGGIVPLSEEVPAPIITMEVPNIDEHLKKIEEMGGKTITGRTAVDDMGFYAYFKDPEDNTIGLWENVKKA